MPEQFNNEGPGVRGRNRDQAVRPSRRLLSEVAASMGVPGAALPILDELFAGQRSFGATPRRVTNWLVEAGVGSASRVIDVGCGKGSVALSVARRTGAAVRGIDAFPPFLETARRHAAALRAGTGVPPRCEFVAGDLWAERVARSRRYDAVVMLNIAATGPALRLVRGLLRPGGVCVIDDAVDVSRREADLGATDTPRLAEIRAEFHAQGFEILREHVFTRAQVRASVAGVTQTLARATRALRQRGPEVHAIARSCLEEHRAAGALLTGSVRPVMWMLQRVR